MSALDDLTVAVQLACLVEDRSDAEQRALLRVARRVDEEANANVVGNRRWGMFAGSTRAALEKPLSTLERLTESTRVLVDDQREVRLKQKNTPAGRHRRDQCAGTGGCGFPLEHPVHNGQGG